MPSNSLPPSKKNPVGSFVDAGSGNSTDLPVTIDKNDANLSEQDDMINTLTKDQGNITDDEGSSKIVQKDNFELFLEQKKAARRKASNEKEFQRLLMDIFRKVQDWNTRYTGLLSTSGMLVNDEQKTEISDYIIEYISAIQVNSDEAENAKIRKDAQDYTPDAEMVWTLFLILFESTLNGKKESVVGELRNWMDTYMPPDLTQLDSATDVDWDFAQRLILNGDTKNAGEYFINFVDQGAEYTRLATILATTPEPPTSVSISYGSSNWTEEWDHWHSGVVSLWNDSRQMKHMDDDGGNAAATAKTGLVSLMNILMGDKAEIQKMGTFGQKCLATLLYTDPRSHQFNMQKIANQVYDWQVDGNAVSVFIYNMLNGDFDSLIGSLDGNLWMQAHFGHLLLATGYITPEANDEADDSHEQVTEPIYYVLQLYAIEIAQKYGMWTEAMEAIMMCKSNRNIWIKALLGEPPLASEDLDYVKDVLYFCTTHKLTAIEASLYSAIAKRYESNEDYVSAATHYADANDVDALDKMATEHLKIYLANGILRPVVTESKYSELVDRSQPYSFYRRYHGIKSHYKGMGNGECYQATINLLQYIDCVPQNYRAVLLVDLFGLTKDFSSTKKQDYLVLLQLLDQVIEDTDQKAFISTYYDRTHTETYPPLPVDTVIEKLRQRFGFCFAANMLSL